MTATERIATDLNTRLLAAEFNARLLIAIGAEKFRVVCLRNKAERDAGVCHSHDFIDANEVMLGAFGVVLCREMDLQSDADLGLWSRAWELAKQLQKEALGFEPIIGGEPCREKPTQARGRRE